ncbi:hypothetical protein FB567DRAFT_619633 [Paraphoma chrysanthemicola]|uniref:Uncharacterized protein n=1 Tax=Paraphoma chrysanthemicola TaxID=798071 RepID=A0A8K0R7M6_9PLEO|nr:hypothetical protein FB567DRAFT_619633 [Paraphoma chrysanthemicola]
MSLRRLLVAAVTCNALVDAQTLASSSIQVTQTTVTRGTASISSTPNRLANVSIDDNPLGALNATAWSLIYTYPLYIFGNFAGSVLRNVGVNQIFHQRALASIDSSAVIKPNVDTVYSRAVLDLSSNDVVLTIPNITDRYWVYPIYHPYGNDIAEIGIVNNNTEGDYLIRRADDVQAPPGYCNTSSVVQSVIPSLQDSAKYAGVNNLPTTHATILIRLLVRENTTADLNIIQRYQNASALREIPRAVSYAPSPPANSSLSSLPPNGSLLGIDSPAKILAFASQLASERQRVAGILGQAGVYGGYYTPLPGVNLTLAAQIANSSLTADIIRPENIRFQSNDWQLSIPEYQGNFGKNYAGRAYVAIFGYQQLRVDQVLYPGYKTLGFTSQFSLAPNTSLLFTFSGKPPVTLADYGFWSLTVYGANQYLIPNPVNRLSVGDRLYTITYQGSNQTVYGPNANATQDGPFQILLQPADLRPPANWTGNWLPVARDFSFITRWYVPQPALTNGSYVYPKGEIIKAIV